MRNWVLGIPRDDSRCRLFCFHHAGGGGSFFAPWVRPAKEAGVELLPVQLPGRENRLREPLISDVVELTQRLADTITPLLDRPFGLFGHSYGGILAFELARELRRRSAPSPHRLMTSAVGAPRLQVAAHPSPVGVTEDEFFVAVMNRYGESAGLSFANSELKALYLPVLVADFRAMAGYRYQTEPAFDFPLHVFAGRDDNTVNHDALAAWQEETTRPLQTHMYAGGHFYLRRQLPVLRDILAPSDGWPA